jgi:hypothetical protein
MKSLIYLIVLSHLFLFSCQKENIEPTTPPAEAKQEIGLYGKWLLIGGTMYIENLETNKKVKYSHFGSNRPVSSLNYNGINFNIELLEINVTTWSFYRPPLVPGFGRFALNNDTLNLYGFYVTKNNWTIMENPQSTISTMQMSGSAKPIYAEIFNFSDSIVNFYIQEAYTPINNQNCRYISELKFKKIETW